ncbi:protoporphyrinogen oxidase [Rubripirellula amarantea]|uniref:protoporphyrinogen oxidase n=1 Tax=Rubripirellula amarantea TaxID=2527999 RepID=UPI0028F42878|nr:protoporphyrinogen oxidase [Rubripirellula amarantea]
MAINQPYRVAIIGGGLSGLATAVQLHLANQSNESPLALVITVYEASDRVGGVIHTERIQSDDGSVSFLVDHGADMFATQPAAALDLCRKLGVEDQLIEPLPTRRGARICQHGKLIPIPDGFVLMRATKLMPMLTTDLLTWRGKLRWLAERFIPSSQPVGDTDENLDESVASFVQRRMGREVLDRIVAPLSAGIYTADVNQLSMRSTMGPIYAMEREHGSLAKATHVKRKRGEDSEERNSTGARYGRFRAFEGGMIELVRSLVSALPTDSIKVNSPVRSLDLVPGSNRSGNQVLLGFDSGTQETFDHAVIALPPKAAKRLLRTVSNQSSSTPANLIANTLGQIPSASTAIVVMGVRRADIAKDIETFGFVVPLSEGRRILAGSFASHKFAGRAPDDHVLVRVFVGGAMQSDLLDLDDQAIIELVREELSEIIGLSGDPVFAKVVRWNDAMPQYHVGHHRLVKKVRKALDELPSLDLTSNSLDGVGIAPVIRQAEVVASSVLESLQQRSNKVSPTQA